MKLIDGILIIVLFLFLMDISCESLTHDRCTLGVPNPIGKIFP